MSRSWAYFIKAAYIYKEFHLQEKLPEVILESSSNAFYNTQQLSTEPQITSLFYVYKTQYQLRSEIQSRTKLVNDNFEPDINVPFRRKNVKYRILSSTFLCYKPTKGCIYQSLQFCSLGHFSYRTLNDLCISLFFMVLQDLVSIPILFCDPGFVLVGFKATQGLDRNGCL